MLRLLRLTISEMGSVTFTIVFVVVVLFSYLSVFSMVFTVLTLLSK